MNAVFRAEKKNERIPHHFIFLSPYGLEGYHSAPRQLKRRASLKKNRERSVFFCLFSRKRLVNVYNVFTRSPFGVISQDVGFTRVCQNVLFFIANNVARHVSHQCVLFFCYARVTTSLRHGECPKHQYHPVIRFLPLFFLFH